MKTLKTLLILVLIISLSSCSITKHKNYIKITCIAIDSSVGAKVITISGDQHYFLGNMNPWSKDILGKKLIVTGLLQKVDMDSLYRDDPLVQRVGGVKHTILKPKWKIIANE